MTGLSLSRTCSSQTSILEILHSLTGRSLEYS